MGAWRLFFSYLILKNKGGAIGEEDIPNLDCLVVILVISRFVFYKPPYVYEKEG